MSHVHPLFRRFENWLTVGEYELEWTIYERDFFFRPQDAEVEVIWCCPGKYRYERQLLNPQQEERTGRKVKKEMLALHALRFWPLEGYDLFFRSRYGLVRSTESDDLAQFQVSRGSYSPNRLLTTPDELQEIVQSSREKTAEAVLWLNAPESQRGWHQVHWPWGTHEELKSLLRAMAALVRQPQNEDLLWQCQIRPNFRAGIQLNKRFPHSAVPLRARYKPFLDCLITHFPVESECVVFYNKWAGEAREFWPQVDLSSAMPTAHGKLEALLTWRDFLQNKIPAAAIEALLSPFH